MAKKRMLSWLIAASLTLSLLPTAALAAEGETQKTLPQELLEPAKESSINPADSAANTLNDAAYDALNPDSKPLPTGQHHKDADIVDEVTGEVKGDALNKADAANTAASTANGKVTEANTAAGTANTAVSEANTAIGTANTAIGTANTAIGDANTAIGDANTAIGEANAETAKAQEAAARADTAAKLAAEQIVADTAKVDAVEDSLNVETEDGGKKAVTDIIEEQKTIAETAAEEAASAALNGDVAGAVAAQATAENAVNAASDAYSKAQDQFVSAVKNILSEDAFAAIEAPAEDASDEEKAAYNQALIDAARTALQTKYDNYNSTINAASGLIDSASGKIDIASGKIDTANTAIGDANGKINTANGLISDANGLISDANGLIGTANGLIGTANGLIGTANGLIGTANTKVSEAVTALQNAQRALNNAQAQLSAANSAKTEVEDYLKLLTDTNGNEAVVKDLKDADTALTTAKTDAASKKTTADGMEPSGDSRATAEDRILRDTSNKDYVSTHHTLNKAAEIINSAMQTINDPNASSEKKEKAMKDIFVDKSIWDDTLIDYGKPSLGGLGWKAPYYLILDDIKDNKRGHGSDTLSALNRLIANLDVVKANSTVAEKTQEYNQAETALKNSLKDSNGNYDNTKVIEAVKAFGTFKDANTALANQVTLAQNAQNKVNEATEAYNLAKAAVKGALDALTKADGSAKQIGTLESMTSNLSQLETIGTLDELTKLETLADGLKRAPIQDADVQALLDNLDAALADLKSAKKDKDDAEAAKEAADQAVEDAEAEAERRRQELEEITGTTTDDDDTAATIEDAIVPLAGLIDRQTLVSSLYTHEGSPDGVDAEGTYTLALAWAVAKDVVDEEDDPEEVVTVAILRDVMSRYAKLLNRTFTVEIPGEDDDIVMNCDEILTAFFAG